MNNHNYGIVIQARMSSTRLPGKVMMDVEGKPMIQRQIDRIKNRIDNIPVIVATSSHPSDDPINDFCKKHQILNYRGPLDNVLLRFILCAKENKLTHIIRVGGDDPLIDPECCLELIRIHSNESCGFLYASNRKGWPYGCAAELISLKHLEFIHKNTNDKKYLEHIIPFFFDYPDQFKTLKVHSPQNLCRPDLAFTVDYPEDIELVRSIFKEFKDEDYFFSMADIISLIDGKPELKNINQHLHNGFER